MEEYGIGRVPKDVDPIKETLAEIEAEELQPTPMHVVKPGDQICPAGTTFGQYTPGARCEICGRPANWNPGAGQSLCARHWDEY